MAQIEMHNQKAQAVNHHDLQGTLMVFSRWRLFGLMITSMMVGIGFFLFGYMLGYTSGRAKAVSIVTQALLDPANATPELQQTMKLLKLQTQQEQANQTPAADTNKIDLQIKYIVHIGLFSEATYANQAWNQVNQYSKLSPSEAITKVHINGKELYKVIVGQFADKDSAKLFVQNIIDNNSYPIYPVIEAYEPKLDSFTKIAQEKPSQEKKA